MLVKTTSPVPEDDTAASPETMATVVYRKVRADILAGRLEPGGRLRIELLTERYGVGASPMREALNRLSSENFVRRYDQRGFQVAPVSMEELGELTRTRCLLNEVTLREAIANGDIDWEDQIILTGNRLNRTERTLSDGSVNPVWEDRHRSFHMALIAACGSRWLIDLTASLFDSADRYRNLSARAGTKDRDAVDEHQTIMDAVLDRKTDEAIRLLNAHFAKTIDVIAASPLAEPEGAALEAAPTRRRRRSVGG